MRESAIEMLPNRGYAICYHVGAPNMCPGCARSQWHVGRSSAECAFCGVALPLAGSGVRFHPLESARAA